MVEGGWITVYDHHSETQRLVLLPANVEDPFDP